MLAQASQVSPSSGGAALRKGRPVRLVVAFVPVVHAGGGHGHAHPVAFGEDDVALIAASFSTVDGDGVRDTRTHVEVGQASLFRMKRTSPVPQSMSTSCGPGGTKICASSHAARNACSYV